MGDSVFIVVEYDGEGSIPKAYFGAFRSEEIAKDFVLKNPDERECIPLATPTVKDWRQHERMV